MKTSTALLCLTLFQFFAGSLLISLLPAKYEWWIAGLTVTGCIAAFIGSRSAANLEYLQEEDFKRLELEHGARKNDIAKG